MISNEILLSEAIRNVRVALDDSPHCGVATMYRSDDVERTAPIAQGSLDEVLDKLLGLLQENPLPQVRVEVPLAEGAKLAIEATESLNSTGVRIVSDDGKTLHAFPAHVYEDMVWQLSPEKAGKGFRKAELFVSSEESASEGRLLSPSLVLIDPTR